MWFGRKFSHRTWQPGEGWIWDSVHHGESQTRGTGPFCPPTLFAQPKAFLRPKGKTVPLLRSPHLQVLKSKAGRAFPHCSTPLEEGERERTPSRSLGTLNTRRVSLFYRHSLGSFQRGLTGSAPGGHFAAVRPSLSQYEMVLEEIGVVHSWSSYVTLRRPAEGSDFLLDFLCTCV